MLQARIDLGLGHPDLALAAMNRVLDQGGADIPPRLVGSMYEWRAQAEAGLHNYRDAFSDLQESSRYPGGLALRLARVKRYREDKPAAQADTMQGVRRIYQAQAGAAQDR